MISLFILLGLHLLGLGYVISKHGEQRKDKYNIFVSLISLAFHLWMYYNMGVFNLIH